MLIPSRNHQTETFDRLNRLSGLAKGTPLSVRIVSGRPKSPFTYVVILDRLLKDVQKECNVLRSPTNILATKEESMDPIALVIWLAIGAVAGWLAGQIMKGGGFGLLGDIIVGIVGAAVAGFILPRLGIVIGGNLIAAIINATIGACLLLFVLRLIKR